MRAVIQRVLSASVAIDGETVSAIEKGFLVLVGIGVNDTARQAEYIAAKISAMRIFEDENEKMNLSLKEVGGSVLAVSNFTLYGDCKKGNRPSFIAAARPEKANELYELFCEKIRQSGIQVCTGVFGADMKVSILNDGPITIVMDTDEMGI